jgi:hypothetical protein
MMMTAMLWHPPPAVAPAPGATNRTRGASQRLDPRGGGTALAARVDRAWERAAVASPCFPKAFAARSVLCRVVRREAVVVLIVLVSHRFQVQTIDDTTIIAIQLI